MHIDVYDGPTHLGGGDYAGPVELGRRNEREPTEFAVRVQAGSAPAVWRLLVARLDEDTVSRRHAFLEPMPDGRVRVRNVSAKLPVGLPEYGSAVAPGASLDLTPPFALTLGPRSVRVGCSGASASVADAGADAPLHSLSGETVPPGQLRAPADWPLERLPGAGDVEGLVRWLQTVLGDLHDAATADALFAGAARALVERFRLDSGRVLLPAGDDWRDATAAGPRQFSNRVLDQVKAWRRPCWQAIDTGAGGSLMGVQAVVAAPVLSPAGEVVAVLYGDRRLEGPRRPELAKVEAMLVEL